MTATIIQRSNDILALAREKNIGLDVNEIIGNAAFVTTLLPLTMAYMIPLATSDPRVSQLKQKNNFKIFLSKLFFFKSS